MSDSSDRFETGGKEEVCLFPPRESLRAAAAAATPPLLCPAAGELFRSVSRLFSFFLSPSLRRALRRLRW